MILKKKEFKKIVNKLKKEFCLKERCKKHLVVTVYYKEKFVTMMKCSKGRDDIPPIWAHQIKKRLNFSSDEEFRDFIECTIKCKDYLNSLKVRDVL